MLLTAALFETGLVSSVAVAASATSRKRPIRALLRKREDPSRVDARIASLQNETGAMAL